MSTDNAGEGLRGHFCGQTQSHGAHEWHTPTVYGRATVVGVYQCAGLTPAQPHETGDTDDA